MLRIEWFFLCSEEKVDLFQFKSICGPSLFRINLGTEVIFVELTCGRPVLDVFD